MSRVCHECGRNVENPYFSMSLIVMDRTNNRVAFSDVETSLCKSEVDKVNSDLQDSPERLESVVGFALDGTTGVVGGPFRTVQISPGVSERHMNYRFLDRGTALQRLPKSASDLIKNPCGFLEYDNDKLDWREADWAQRVYEEAFR